MLIIRRKGLKMPAHGDSAIEKYQSDPNTVNNVEIFSELFSYIFTHLYYSFPVPEVMISISATGGAGSMDSRLADVFSWTLQTMNAKNLIEVFDENGERIEANKIKFFVDSNENPPLCRLTSRGMHMITSEVQIEGMPAGSRKMFLDVLNTFTRGQIREKNYLNPNVLTTVIVQKICAA